MRRRAMPPQTPESDGGSGGGSCGHFGRPYGSGRRAWRAYSKTRAELPTRLFSVLFAQASSHKREENRRRQAASSSYAVCRARTASPVYSAATSTLILISDVELT